MKDYPRSARIGNQIQQVVSDVLRKKTKDPRLHDVGITAVKMSSDLSKAYIYFALSIPGKKAKKDAEAGFKSAKGFLKKTIGKELNLRYIPELNFLYDSALDNGQKIDDLLKSLKEKENWSKDDIQDS